MSTSRTMTAPHYPADYVTDSAADRAVGPDAPRPAARSVSPSQPALRWAAGLAMVVLLLMLVQRLWPQPPSTLQQIDSDVAALVGQQWALAQAGVNAAAQDAGTPLQSREPSNARFWQTLGDTTRQQTAWAVSLLEEQERLLAQPASQWQSTGSVSAVERLEWRDAQSGLASRASAWADWALAAQRTSPSATATAAAPPLPLAELHQQAQLAAAASQRFLARIEHQAVLRAQFEPAVATVALLLASIGAGLLCLGLKAAQGNQQSTVALGAAPADAAPDERASQEGHDTLAWAADAHLPAPPRQLLSPERFMQLAARAVMRQQQGSALGFALVAVQLQAFDPAPVSLGTTAESELAAAIERRLFDTLEPGCAVALLGEPLGQVLDAAPHRYLILMEGLLGSVGDTDPATNALHAKVQMLNAEMRDAYTVLDHPVRAKVAMAVLPGHEFQGPSKNQLDAALGDLALALREASKTCEVTHFAPLLREQRERELSLQREFEQALAQHQFSAAFEAVVDLNSGQPLAIHAEAVWAHGLRGLLPMSDFLDDLVTAGLVRRLSQHFSHLALTQFKQWRDQMLLEDGAALSLPLWPEQLGTDAFVDDTVALLAEFGVAPQRLELRLTQAAAAGAAQQHAVQRLRQLGVRLTLEGLGSASPSLQALHALPVSTVCVGSGFVSQVLQMESQAMLVSAVVRVAAPLGIAVRAQGVQTLAQCEALQKLGVAQGQGPYFGGAVGAGQSVAKAKWFAPSLVDEPVVT